MAVSPVIQALRAATAADHHAIEREADVERRLRDPLTRVRMVSRLLAFHLSVEQRLAPWRTALDRVGCHPQARSALIREGLAALGEPAVDVVETAPLGTFGQALGWAYVAEGSMLGGRVMRRAMIADGVSLTGLDFLDPYGEDAGVRWRAFLGAIDAACAQGLAAPADICRGGKDAFTLASRLLVDRASVEFA
ncbi:hypothetical protein GCM10009116_15440 [Brevundimonas basaltis]|uniref:Heme oxygenase n=1 Tax=Brevundimonas basaltis TaxID=472166 RepID=A0A7W8HY06_9CAUL|nr:biliverdin-producing heme oxygenase [Brevundimonas basaltis]MBB5291143.1 heme oxygenase [Brevundimonas basaltis]